MDLKTPFESDCYGLSDLFFIIGAWVVRNYLALNQFILFSTQGADPLIAGADPFNKIGYENIVNEMRAKGLDDKGHTQKN